MRLGSESGISYLKRESIKMCLFFFLTRENQNKMTLLNTSRQKLTEVEQ